MDEQGIPSTKACPRCFEPVHEKAEICRYCRSRIGAIRNGQQVRVRIKAGEKSYRGDLFVANGERLSDAINDTRRFIVLSNAKEEGRLSDISIGFLALNKGSIESIRMCEDNEGKDTVEVRQIY